MTTNREVMHYDVVIVGAGPAGLATAIRLKQLKPEHNVVVVEKGVAVGAHTLSGAVIDPVGINALFPHWRAHPRQPLRTQVTEDHFYWLGPDKAWRLPRWPMPHVMSNHGAYIGSLGALTRWLAAQAEDLGVEIYPGFPATEILYGDKDQVLGIATGDQGITRDGAHKRHYTRGMELRGRYTFFAEGARGSLTKQLLAKFQLDAGREPQKFGLGIKEIWQVTPEMFREGLVQHSFGWPLSQGATGGSFLYHYSDNLMSIGFVVHLDYTNPTLSPYDEFQRFKTHPHIRGMFEGAKRLSYGARVIASGGFQSVPKLVFPGGALVGCAAGFVNFARIKGVHNAILSGIQGADAAHDALEAGRAHDEISAYEQGWRRSAIGKDLRPVRNVKPLWTRLGLGIGVPLGGLDMWMNSPFGTLKHRYKDHETLKPLSEVTPIVYPKPNGKITFDRASSVYLSSTDHEEDQPTHLHLADPTIPVSTNLPRWGEPAQLYCPAGVYEIVSEKDNLRFVINAQNCVHCKTCDIKDPSENITWVPPEGSGGPSYQDM